MYMSKQAKLWCLIIILFHYLFNATDSQPNSPTRHDRSPSPEFDWESMIDWSYSPEKDKERSPIQHNTGRAESADSSRIPSVQPSYNTDVTMSSINQISTQANVAKTKKKYKNFKERYSEETRKEKTKRYYKTYRSDPIKLKRVQDGQRTRRQKRKAEMKELLETLPKEEQEEILMKKKKALERRRYLYRLKKDPNATQEPIERQFKTVEEKRMKARERGARHRLKKKLIAERTMSKVYPVQAIGSREGSPSGSLEFDWESMIDWPSSPDTAQSGTNKQHSNIQPIDPQNTPVHTTTKVEKKKTLSKKERYTVEQLKEMNRTYYIKARSDPKRLQIFRTRRLKAYHQGIKKKRERLANATEAELKAEAEKKRAKNDRKNYLARLKRNPNALPKKEFKLSESHRIYCREKTRISRLKRKEKEQENSTQC